MCVVCVVCVCVVCFGRVRLCLCVFLCVYFAVMLHYNKILHVPILNLVLIYIFLFAIYVAL